MNYNIKKNIINLNINPDDGNSSIYEHENNEFSEDKKMKKYYDKLNDDNIQENYNNYKHKKKNSNKSLTHKNNYYKDLEEGKWVKIEGWFGIDEAKHEILESIARYNATEAKPEF